MFGPYSVEVRHDELGKYRIIRGRNKFEAEQKAKAQLIAWQKQYSRECEAEARRTIREARAKSKELALELTRANRELREQLMNVLAGTLAVNDAIDWDSLKDKSSFAEPEPVALQPPSKPPRPEERPLRLRLRERLFSSLRRRAIAEHERSEKARLESWEAHCREIDNDYEAALEAYAAARRDWVIRRAAFIESRAYDNAAIDAQAERYMRGDPDAVIEYCDMVLSRSKYPDTIKKTYNIEYDPDKQILVVDWQLPLLDELPVIREVRYVASRDEFEERRIPDKEADEFYNKVVYSICLRTVHEMFEADVAGVIASCVFNGHIRFVDQATGREERACILSLMTEKATFAAINLGSVEPAACFRKLKGLGSPRLRERVPVQPLLQLSRDDPRFVPSMDLSGKLVEGVNIATMGWEEFEHLVREVFEREFATANAEVKVTRSTRDAGVDAIIFDPDPIRGGKIVVQAKRYTGTVGVAAVRDLYGTLINEGATKGVLVTTSSFGPDAYEFAKGKPIALIDGSNLLYLVEKHGTKARIDLDEARRLGVSMQRFTP